MKIVNVKIKLYSFEELSKESKVIVLEEHSSFLISVNEYTEDTIEVSDVINDIEANKYLYYVNGVLADTTIFFEGHPNEGETWLALHGDSFLVEIKKSWHGENI